jgi:hypothetical protein
LLLGCLGLAPSAAWADLQMSARGPVAFLKSNHLDRGDEETFAQFLASPEGSRTRIVYLDSRGGNTMAAIAIGRQIRERQMDTAYHVGRARCVSACTTMFLGGVHRYYIGGDHVANGVATHVGLGFHPSNGNMMNEDRIGSYYADMGVSGAANERYRLYSRDSVAGGGRFDGEGPGGPGWGPGPGGPGPGWGPDSGPDGPGWGPDSGPGGGGPRHKYKLFFISGAEAMRAGVATNLGEPPQGLRDDR